MSLKQIFSTLAYQTEFKDFDSEGTTVALKPHFEQLSRNDNGHVIDGSRPLERTLTFDLHKDPSLKHVVDFITHHAMEYWKACGYTTKYDPYITQMWAIQTKTGGFTPAHNHNPFPVSGAFYVYAPEGSGDLYLENPLEPLLGKMPYDMSWGPTSFDESVNVHTGKLVLFPGWCKHYSKPNGTPKTRTVIAFNFGTL